MLHSLPGTMIFRRRKIDFILKSRKIHDWNRLFQCPFLRPGWWVWSVLDDHAMARGSKLADPTVSRPGSARPCTCRRPSSPRITLAYVTWNAFYGEGFRHFCYSPKRHLMYFLPSSNMLPWNSLHVTRPFCFVYTFEMRWDDSRLQRLQFAKSQKKNTVNEWK